jgi:hypothetical protein
VSSRSTRAALIGAGVLLAVVAVIAAAVVVVKLEQDDTAAPASGPQVSDIVHAIGRLRTDIDGAAGDQIDPATKTALVTSTDAAASAASSGALCAAQSSLAPTAQTLAGSVKANAPTTGPGAPVAARTAARLDADDLDAQAMILTSAGTESCGGAPPAGHAVATSASGAFRGGDGRSAELHTGFPVPVFAAQEGDGHWYVAMSEQGTTSGSSGSFGKPGVPVSGEQVAVPTGATPTVSTSSVTSYELAGVPLLPAQPSPIDGPPIGKDGSSTALVGDTPAPFTIDAGAYRSAQPYPAATAGMSPVESQHGLRIADAWTAAGQYTATDQTLRVITGEDETITFGGANTGTFGPDDLTSAWNVAFTSYWDATISNWSAVGDHLEPKTKLPDPCGEEMMVIATTQVAYEAASFAQSRTDEGVLSKVFVTDGDHGIGTSEVAIHDAIAREVTNSCRIHPSYVILFGDTSQVPTFHFEMGTTSGGLEDDIASDLPFAFLHQWDQMHPVKNTGSLVGARDEYVSADLTDLTPDVFVSRVPAANAGEANLMDNAVRNYEYSPPTDPSYYANVTGAEYFQPCNPQGCPGCPPKTTCDPATPAAPAPSTQELTPFLRASEDVGLYAQAAHKRFNRIANDDSANSNGQVVNPATYYDGGDLPSGIDWTGGPDQISSAYDHGTMLLWHADHGYADGSGWYQPALGAANVQTLGVGPATIVWSSDCDSGKFDQPSGLTNVSNGAEEWFGRQWLFYRHATAFVGASRESYVLEDGWLLESMGQSLFPEFDNAWRAIRGYKLAQPAPTMGALVAEAKAKFLARIEDGPTPPGDIQINSILLQYNLFGDPSMPIYRGVPGRFTPSQTVADVSADKVELRGPASMDGAWATVVEGDQVYGRAYVRDGVASIDVPTDLTQHHDVHVILDGLTDVPIDLTLQAGSANGLAPSTSTTVTAPGAPEPTSSGVPTSTGATSPTSAVTVPLTAPPTTTASKAPTTTVPAPTTTAGPLPIVSQLSKTVGGPGTQIYVYGDYYDGLTAVHFGSVAATQYTLVDHGSVLVTVPSMSNGKVDITVTTGAGTSLTSPSDVFDVSS